MVLKIYKLGGYHMPILVILTVISFSFYIFYKIKSIRTKKPAEKKWVSSKAAIALGFFTLFFGLNQLALRSTTTSFIVALVFIVVGGLYSYANYKAYKHYLPYAINEAESN
jgi:hypothetical protein